MTFVAEELHTFSIKTLKHSTLKNSSVSIISGSDPLQIFLWPARWAMAHRLRNPDLQRFQ